MLSMSIFRSLLITVVKVMHNHELRVWKRIAIRQLGKRWALVARVHKYVHVQKQNMHFHVGPDKGKAIAIQHDGLDKGKALAVQKVTYPPAKPTRLVVAPSFQRIRKILPEMQGILLTKEWLHELQTHAVQGPHLKIVMLYYEYLL